MNTNILIHNLFFNRLYMRINAYEIPQSLYIINKGNFYNNF